MRLRRLTTESTGHFTLVTLDDPSSTGVLIPNLAELTGPHYSAILSTFDFPHLNHLEVERGCHVSLPALIDCVHRHQRLDSLSLQPGSLSRTSSGTDFSMQPPTGTVSVLSAPAAYIPHILPVVPTVKRILMAFGAWSVDIPGAAAFDLCAWAHAAQAIAQLPGTHRLSVLLDFAELRSTRCAPWGPQTTSTPCAPSQNFCYWSGARGMQTRSLHPC